MVKLTFDNVSSKLGKPVDPRKLKEINLPNKMIDDIGSFSKFELLEKVDLSHNRLSFERQIIGLFDAKKTLRELTLIGNPLSKTKNYRLFIIYNLPNLEVLDNVEVTSKERELAERVIGKGEDIKEEISEEVDEEEEELQKIREKALLKKLEQDRLKELEKEERRSKRLEEEKLYMERAEQEKLAYQKLIEENENKGKNKKSGEIDKKLESQEIKIIETKNTISENEDTTTETTKTFIDSSKQEVLEGEHKNVESVHISQSNNSKILKSEKKEHSPDKRTDDETSKKDEVIEKTTHSSPLSDRVSQLKIKEEEIIFSSPIHTEENLFKQDKKRFDILNMDTGGSVTQSSLQDDDIFSSLLDKNQSQKSKKASNVVIEDDDFLNFLNKKPSNKLSKEDDDLLALLDGKKKDKSQFEFTPGFSIDDYINKSSSKSGGGLFD